MNAGTLRSIVEQAINEYDNADRVRPSWVATRAVQLADPRGESPASMSFAAELQFRQIAREVLRTVYDPDVHEEPRQHRLFPQLQAKYPRHVTGYEEPEYVAPEFLSEEDVAWNVETMRARAHGLLRGADALEAWWEARNGKALPRRGDDRAQPDATH